MRRSVWYPLVRVVAGGYVVLSATSLRADTEGPLWHGFLTTGPTFSDSSVPYSGGTDRRADFTRNSVIGLNLEEHLDPRWDFAAQVLAAGAAVIPDWAFVTYFPAKGLSLRAGKQKVPIWLISDHLDVGHTYPWVRPPEEVYSLNPINAVTGLGGTYTAVVGGLELTVELLFAPTSAARQLQPAGDASAAASSGATNIQISDFVLGDVALGTDKFQVRGAVARGTAAVQNPAYSIKRLEAKFGSVGVKVDTGGFLLLSEYAFNAGRVDPNEVKAADADLLAAETQAQQAQNPLAGQAAQRAGVQDYILHGSLVGGHAWYTTVGYQVGDVLPNVTYARLRSPVNSIGNGSQDSATVGARYDFNLKTDLKIQGEHVWPRDQTHGLFDPDATRTSFPQVNIYSAALDVAF